MRDRVQPAMFRALGRAIVAAMLAGPVLVLGPRLLRAQPLFRTIDSLEVTVANADLVFVGHIEGMPAAEGTAGYVGVAVSVEKTVKGDRGEKWGIDLALPRSLVAGWQTRADSWWLRVVTLGPPPRSTFRVIPCVCIPRTSPACGLPRL